MDNSNRPELMPFGATISLHLNLVADRVSYFDVADF
jgi:hypothetical protein